MQAKISADNDCRWLPRVNGGILPALEAKFVLFASGRIFWNLGTFPFIQFKHLDQSKHLLPLKSMVSPANLILFQRRWTVPCWLLKPLSKKIARWKSLHYHQNDRQLAVVTFLVFALIPSEGKITSKSRSWSWIAIETQCIFDKHYWFF